MPFIKYIKSVVTFWAKLSLTRFSILKVLFVTLLLSNNILAQEADSVSSYLINGKPVPTWVASIGNGLNWYVPVEAQRAKTLRKNLTVEPTTKINEGDAVIIKWRGKKVKNEWGGNALFDSSFSISKHNIDIASVKDVAALAIELKLIKAPNENVTLSMQCNYSNHCTQKYPLKSALRSIEKNKWTLLPIPLNCFKAGNDFDYSKVTTIFSIATQGKLEIEIANIGLIALPEGNTGCK